MLGAAFLSLLLFGVAGVMLDTQRRAMRRRRADASLDPQEQRYYERQNRWRTMANVLIAGVAGLVAVWPVVPRTRLWMSVHLALILLAVLVMVALAALDAWAISRRYRRDRLQQIGDQARAALELQRGKLTANASEADDPA